MIEEFVTGAVTTQTGGCALVYGCTGGRGGALSGGATSLGGTSLGGTANSVGMISELMLRDGGVGTRATAIPAAVTFGFATNGISSVDGDNGEMPVCLIHCALMRSLPLSPKSSGNMSRRKRTMSALERPKPYARAISVR